MGIYVIRYEGTSIEDSPADVGVLEDKVLQDLAVYSMQNHVAGTDIWTELEQPS